MYDPRRLGHHRASPLGVWREDAVVDHERISRRRYQRREPRQQLDRRHHAVGAAAPSVLDAVGNAAVGQQAEAIEGEARPRAVADEALAPFVVVSFDPHRRLDVEPVELRGERPVLLPLEAGVAIVRGGRAPAIERGKRAAAEREVGAGVEGAALHTLVAAIFCGTRVEQAVLAEPAKRAIADAPDNAIEHGLGRWRDAVEVNATRAIGGEDSVGENGVKMKIEVEAAAEPLRVVDRCVPAAGDAGGSFLLERDRLDEDAAERTGDVGAERGKAAKLERERENPLAHRHRREDAVDDVGGGVGHATRGAARADASTLAREGDEKIAVTRVAMETEESVGEHAAREVGTEGLLDVPRQSALVALTGVDEECFEVVAHDRVEDRLRRPTRSVGVLGRARSRRRIASRHEAGDWAIAMPHAT